MGDDGEIALLVAVLLGVPVALAGAAWFSYALAVLGCINILYGAYCAMAQTDMKKLVAYSSVSHLGFVVLGLFSLDAAGVAGGIFQMLAHGVATGGLFLIVGLIYERMHNAADED